MEAKRTFSFKTKMNGKRTELVWTASEQGAGQATVVCLCPDAAHAPVV
jgi:hypothetical protein